MAEFLSDFVAISTYVAFRNSEKQDSRKSRNITGYDRKHQRLSGAEVLFRDNIDENSDLLRSLKQLRFRGKHGQIRQPSH